VNSLVKENTSLLAQLESTQVSLCFLAHNFFIFDLFQASLKISEDSRIRAERNLLDRNSIHHSQGMSGDPVSAAFNHSQFVWSATNSSFLFVFKVTEILQ
jgi:hypothetical protein